MFDANRGEEEIIQSIQSGDPNTIDYAAQYFNPEELIAARMVSIASLLWEFRMSRELLEQLAQALSSESVLPFANFIRQLAQLFTFLFGNPT